MESPCGTGEIGVLSLKKKIKNRFKWKLQGNLVEFKEKNTSQLPREERQKASIEVITWWQTITQGRSFGKRVRKPKGLWPAPKGKGQEREAVVPF